METGVVGPTGVALEFLPNRNDRVGFRIDLRKESPADAPLVERDKRDILQFCLTQALQQFQRLGPDFRRLENQGDFNADLDTTGLLSGTYELVLTATDGKGNPTVKRVNINYQAGTVWPQPYAIDWSALASVEEIQDVAQVVDGKWRLENGNVRTAEPGYDRLIAVGDMTWGDYEVTAPITLHSKPASSGVGVLLRWEGHTDEPVVTSNPKSGYYPLGAILWYRSGRLEIFGNNWDISPSLTFDYKEEYTAWSLMVSVGKHF